MPKLHQLSLPLYTKFPRGQTFSIILFVWNNYWPCGVPAWGGLKERFWGGNAISWMATCSFASVSRRIQRCEYCFFRHFGQCSGFALTSLGEYREKLERL